MSVDDDDKKLRLTPEGKFGLRVVLPCVAVVYAVFAFCGQLEMGMGALVAVLSLMLAAKATWQYRGHRWYWIAVAVSVLLQVPVIFHAPLSHQAITGKGILLFGYVDIFVVWGCIMLTKKLMMRNDEGDALSGE